MTQTDLHPVHSVYDGLFNAASGQKISLNDPTVDMISVDDIARGLSNVCRFGGQIPKFYSVAQHSILVMLLAPEHLRKEALLHDAAEAFCGDIIKPLKVILGEAYGQIEDRFMEVIIQKFGLDCNNLGRVKRYDMEALEIEHEYLYKGNSERWQKAWRGHYTADCWLPWNAYHSFKTQFDILFKNGIN